MQLKDTFSSIKDTPQNVCGGAKYLSGRSPSAIRSAKLSVPVFFFTLPAALGMLPAASAIAKLPTLSHSSPATSLETVVSSPETNSVAGLSVAFSFGGNTT